MSIKVFGGLGSSVDTSQTTSATSVAIPGTSESGVIQRDTATGQSGQAGADQTVLQTTVQTQSENLPVAQFNQAQPSDIQMNTGVRPQVFSAKSGQVPFETLFDQFDIQVQPVYNFWVRDEQTNDRDERGERKLEDIPRYIRITWLPAPDLADPDARLPKRVNKKASKSVLFAQELDRASVFRAKGVDFAPSHLQPDGLSKVKASIANGHVAPGVINAIVDLPLVNAGLVQPAQANIIEEDVFLNDPEMTGVSSHELRAQQLQLTNSAIAAGAIGRDGISDNLVQRKVALVDGKFSISKATSPGGTLAIQSVHSSSPVISMYPKTAVPSRPVQDDLARDTLDRVTQPEQFSDVPRTAQTKVKFFNPAIGGLVSADKVQLMSAPEHLETMAALGPSLNSLELLSRTGYYNAQRRFDIPSLPSPKVKPFEYVGYVLERFRRGKTGVFTKIEEIDIPHREITEYIDTKVIYGETYRYRIRAIFRWTRPSDVGIMGKDPTVGKKTHTHTQPTATHKSSYFYSEWSSRWVYATCMDDQPPPPPDELQVRPESARKRVVVTFRLPENSQRDILSMRLFKKILGENGRELTDWIPMVHSDGRVDQPPQNIIFYDTNVEFFQIAKHRYVYAAQCVSRHGEDSPLSEQYATMLNKDYFSRGEYPVEMVSSKGVRVEYFGAFARIPFLRTQTQVVVMPHDTFTLTGRETMGNAMGVDGSYFLRIESLDTGEKMDVPFGVVFRNLKAREQFVNSSIYTPPSLPNQKGSQNFQNKTAQSVSPTAAAALAGFVNSVADIRQSVQPKDQPQPGDRRKG